MFTIQAKCTNIVYSWSWQVAISTFHVNQKFNFQSGQFVLWTFLVWNKTVKRSYSIYSTMSQMNKDSSFSLLAKQTNQPIVSKYLTEQIRVGDEIEITGPLGHLTISKESSKILFLSIGSWVTPIASIMQDIIENNTYQHIINMYGERYRNHIADHTRKLFQTNTNNIQSTIYLSSENPWKWYQVWHIQNGLSTVLPQLWAERTIVICGKPTFVDEMTQIMITHWLTKDQIKSEKY